MNKAMLPRSLWQRLRLWPLPRRVRTDGIALPRLDDDWIMQDFDRRKGIRLSNTRTGHVVQLSFRHIKQYDSEKARNWDGLKHGRLRLRVELTLSGCNLFMRRLRDRRVRRSAKYML